MGNVARVIQGLVLSAVMGNGVNGCSTVENVPSPPLEPIAVTDVSNVAGDWEGLLVRSPPSRSRNDNWVYLHIGGDGAYRFEAFRTIGVFSGHGVFNLENGALVARSEKGTVTVRLHRHAGKDDRVLKAEGGTGDGITYHAEMTPKRR